MRSPAGFLAVALGRRVFHLLCRLSLGAVGDAQQHLHRARNVAAGLVAAAGGLADADARPEDGLVRAGLLAHGEGGFASDGGELGGFGGHVCPLYLVGRQASISRLWFHAVMSALARPDAGTTKSRYTLYSASCASTCAFAPLIGYWFGFGLRAAIMASAI